MPEQDAVIQYVVMLLCLRVPNLEIFIKTYAHRRCTLRLQSHLYRLSEFRLSTLSKHS